MTTSMITTVTTMMIDVGVVPSLEGLLVGCVLLLTGKAVVVVTVPTLEEGVILAEVDAVER